MFSLSKHFVSGEMVTITSSLLGLRRGVSMNRLSAFHLGVYTDLHLWALLGGLIPENSQHV